MRWSTDGRQPEVFICKSTYWPWGARRPHDAVQIWRIVDGKIQRPIAIDEHRFLTNSPKGTYVVTDQPRGDAPTQKEIWSTYTAGHPISLGTLTDPWRNARVDFSADETLLAFSVENRIEVRRVQPGLPLIAQTTVYDATLEPEEYTSSRPALEFSPDNALLLAPERLEERSPSKPDESYRLPSPAYRIEGNALVPVAAPADAVVPWETAEAPRGFAVRSVFMSAQPTVGRQPAVQVLAGDNGRRGISTLRVGPKTITHKLRSDVQWPRQFTNENWDNGGLFTPNPQQRFAFMMDRCGVALWDLHTGKVQQWPAPRLFGEQEGWLSALTTCNSWWSADSSRLTTLSWVRTPSGYNATRVTSYNFAARPEHTAAPPPLLRRRSRPKRSH